MAKPIYLGGISHACGELRPIADIRSLQADPQGLEYLRKLGLATYSKLELPLRGHLLRIAKETLEKSGVAASEIQAVIFFSTTFDFYAEHSDIARIAMDLGLKNAIPFGMFLNQCTNYSQAIMMAKHLILGENFRNILVLGSDLLDDVRNDRTMPSRTSVYSDAVVGCLVSERDLGDFEIEGMAHHYIPEMGFMDPQKDVVKFITNYSDGFSKVCKNLCMNLDRDASRFSRLITANYNLSVLKNLALLAGMPPSKLYLENVPKLAHCFAADQLISLQTLQAEGRLIAEESLLLAAVGGFYIYSAMALRKT